MNNKYSIDSIKLYITEKCILDCDYCFVKDKSQDEMDFSIAKISVQKLLESEGSYKSIYILGGEPLLKLDLIKKVIEYTINLNNNLNKKLNIIISTSGFIKLNKDYISYLNKNDIIISFSIDGLEKYHDKHRYLLNKKGTYKQIISNLQYFNEYKKDNLYGVLTVFPDKDILENIFKSFLNLSYSLGFNSIHVSYVNGLEWSIENQEKYLYGIEKILSFLLYSYNKGEFFFLTSFSRYLVKGEISNNRENCFLKMLEIHTNGDIGHSMWSHFFYDDKRHIDYNIKNIDTGVLKCTKDNDCECNKHKNFFYGDNIISTNIIKLFNRYEKLFGDDYKSYIIKHNKFI